MSFPSLAMTYAGTEVMSLGAWLHDLSPHAIGPFGGGGFSIRWYGLAYLAGFAFGFWMLRVAIKRAPGPLPITRAADFVITVAIGVMVGGRLGYVLFYSPDLIWDWSGDVPFWGVLALNKGGMASHGGFIGMLVATGIFAWRLPKEIDLTSGLPVDKPSSQTRYVSPVTRWLYLMDLTVLCAPVGVFFGRIANFINGELIGREAPATLPWAVKFPQEIADMKLEDLPGPVARVLAEGGARYEQVIAAVQQRDALYYPLIEPILTPRHPSTIYAAITEGLLVFLLVLWFYRRPRKPGVTLGVAMVGYSFARIGNEFFRMPDAGIGFQLFGLSRGQWLTFFVLAGGIAIAGWAWRREVPRMGGLMRVREEHKKSPA